MILFAPDSYGGFLTAPEAVALAQQVQPALIGHPMADGGEGSLATLQWHRGLRMETVSVSGPYGEPVRARLGHHDGGCFVETAEACGLRLTPRRSPRQASTYGVGELLKAAQEPMVIGLGGSATIDGGAGMIAALQGDAPGVSAATLDLLSLQDRLPRLRATVLLDVQTPLAECSAVFGPQKGLAQALVSPMSRALLGWGATLNRWRERRGQRPLPLDLPGGGAAGGLGFALAALGATLVPGAAYFARLTALRSAIQKADAVVVGEGRLDPSSYQGKAAGVVTELARSAGAAVWAVVGSCQAVPPPPLGPDRIIEIGEQDTGAFQDAIRRLIR